MTTRRTFVAQLASSAAVGALAIGARPRILSALDRYPRAGDPHLKELAAKALDAARAAGATYADVRFTLTRTEDVGTLGMLWFLGDNSVHAAVGVRVLADGAWGFAGSNVWSADEAARLGREAAVQAKTNATGRRTKIELAQAPPVVTDEWATPILIDPFTVPLSEKIDVLRALADAVDRVDVPYGVSTYSVVRHRRQEKTFASTDGSFITQTLYLSHPFFEISAGDGPGRYGAITHDGLQPAAAGWENVAQPSLARDIPKLVEEVARMVDAEAVDPDRYDIVADAYTTARLLGATVGMPLELDRALGYEANGAGTSYLSPPEGITGKYALGPAELNVSANRSQPGALATVKWDDEGYVPEEYSIVKSGVVTGYHTSRDGVLGAARPGARSTGCASADSAIGITSLQCPNIVMKPAVRNVTFEDLVAGLDRGLVVVSGTSDPHGSGSVTVDRQLLNGEINAHVVYEVRNGKRTRYIKNSELLFRAPELWKGLGAVGGASSQRTTGVLGRKGQPQQEYRFSVSAVPARFNRVAVTDRSRIA